MKAVNCSCGRHWDGIAIKDFIKRQNQVSTFSGLFPEGKAGASNQLRHRSKSKKRN